jgi:hypothetical protein
MQIAEHALHYLLSHTFWSRGIQTNQQNLKVWLRQGSKVETTEHTGA